MAGRIAGGIIENKIIATDLFPELSGDIDRRISHAEVRIKYWVMAGVLANLVALLGLAIPLTYYLGTLNAKNAVATTDNVKQTERLDRHGQILQSEIVWQAYAESWMEQKGFKPLMVHNPAEITK